MNAHQVPADAAGFTAVTRQGVMTGFAALGLPFAFILFAALAGALIQHQPLWTFEPLMPQFSRISPMAGVKRMFGKEAWVKFAKGLVKIALSAPSSGSRSGASATGSRPSPRWSVAALLPAVLALAIKLLASVLAIFAVLAIGDFVYQRFTWHQRQRMTKQELKDEYKNPEGNPEIKAKLRQIRAAARAAGA